MFKIKRYTKIKVWLFLYGKIELNKKLMVSKMNRIESYINAKEDIKNIRAIELRFDKIIRNANVYILMQDDIRIGTANRETLTEKTMTLLDSLAEMSK